MKRATRLSALVLAATLALSGCSGLGMREGAVIDGTSYSVQEVQQAVGQINSVAAQPVDVRQIIHEAAIAPLIDGAFTGSPYEVTDAELSSTMSGAGLEEDPNPLALQSARFRHYAGILNAPGIETDPEMQPVIERLNEAASRVGELDVEVNPRFGTWDPQQGVVAEVPAWISQPSAD